MFAIHITLPSVSEAQKALSVLKDGQSTLDICEIPEMVAI